MSKISLSRQLMFTEREDINDILRDSDIISELYDITLQHLFTHGEERAVALSIFNDAYYICTLAIGAKAGVDVISNCLEDDNMGNITNRKLTYCVAWSILRVHQELVEVDNCVLEWLRQQFRNTEYNSCYGRFIRNYAGSFTNAINFACNPVLPNLLQVERPAHRSWADVTNHFNADTIREIVFRYAEYQDRCLILQRIKEACSIALTSNYYRDHRWSSLRSLDFFDTIYQEIEEEHSDVQPTAVSADMPADHHQKVDNILSSLSGELNDLMNENKQKDERIAELENQLQNERRARLQQQLLINARQIVNPTSPHIEQVSAATDPTAEAINYKTIADYACGLSSKAESDIISNMLGKLALRYNLHDEELNNTILNIDKVQNEKHLPKPPQTNFDIQHVDTLAPAASSVSPQYHNR